MSVPTHKVRVIWPVLDPSLPIADLLREAETDLPDVLTRTHAHVTGRGRFWLAPSDKVPGSGRVTDTVLLYEAPARPVPRRSYWKSAS